MTARAARSALLDELVRVAGYDRKHAITLMNQTPSKRLRAGKKRSGRPRAYRHCLSVIETAWETLDSCCAERLHPQLVPLATKLARHNEVQVTREAREELARISRATLARRLAELPRGKPRLARSGPHPSRMLTTDVPIDRYRWNEDRPGALAVDLVEHNGSSRSGHDACTLSVVSTAIDTYVEADNDNPKPFMWTATAEEILTKHPRTRSPTSSQLIERHDTSAASGPATTERCRPGSGARRTPCGSRTRD